MKKIYFLVGFLLLTGFTQAQDKEIDSLTRLLENHKKADTIRIKLLYSLAFYHTSTDQKKGIAYADEAIKLAKKLKSPVFLRRAYSVKGDNYMYAGADSLAKVWYNKSLETSRQNNDKMGEAMALGDLAYLSINQSAYKKAAELRIQALALYKELKDEKKIALVLTNIGVSYFYMADYPQALKYYLQGLQASEKINDKASIASAFANIGLVYKRLNNLNKALEYYHKASPIYLAVKNEPGYIDNLNSIGTIYDLQDQHQKAINVFEDALAYARKINYVRGQTSLLTNIGVAYSSLKQYSLAITNLKESLQLLKRSSDLNGMIVPNNELAHIISTAPDSALRNAGIPISNRFNEAQKYAELSLKVSKEIESPDRELESWKALGGVLELKKDYKGALDAYKQVFALKDSISNDSKNVEIARLEAQYDAEKNKAIAAEELKNEKNIRNLSIGGLICIALVSLIVFIFYKKHRDALQKQNDLLYKAKVADTDMRILRLQMNPHFIFNSLNSISDYISKNDIRNADYYLAKFAKLMRGILENSEEKEILLADELKMLELYMQLEGSRLNHKFTYEIRVSPDIDSSITLVPPLILQPFVENSIWHGLVDKETDGKILIEVTRDNSLLNCVVEDNGIGRKAAKKETGKSYGMKITKDRIELLNKLKNTNASINLVDLEHGTRVEVNLPFETDL